MPRCKIKFYGRYALLCGVFEALVDEDISTLQELFTWVKNNYGFDLSREANLRLIIGNKVCNFSSPGDILGEGEIKLIPVVAGG